MSRLPPDEDVEEERLAAVEVASFEALDLLAMAKDQREAVEEMDQYCSDHLYVVLIAF